MEDTESKMMALTERKTIAEEKRKEQIQTKTGGFHGNSKRFTMKIWQTSRQQSITDKADSLFPFIYSYKHDRNHCRTLIDTLMT